VIGSKATATFTSTQTGKAESLTMKGNWTDSSADIIDEAQNSTSHSFVPLLHSLQLSHTSASH
jgi:hypothetical protein